MACPSNQIYPHLKPVPYQIIVSKQLHGSLPSMIIVALNLFTANEFYKARIFGLYGFGSKTAWHTCIPSKMISTKTEFPKTEDEQSFWMSSRAFCRLHLCNAGKHVFDFKESNSARAEIRISEGHHILWTQSSNT